MKSSIARTSSLSAEGLDVRTEMIRQHLQLGQRERRLALELAEHAGLGKPQKPGNFRGLLVPGDPPGQQKHLEGAVGAVFERRTVGRLRGQVVIVVHGVARKSAAIIGIAMKMRRQRILALLIAKRISDPN